MVVQLLMTKDRFIFEKYKEEWKKKRRKKKSIREESQSRKETGTKSTTRYGLPSPPQSDSSMDHFLGLLRIHVRRGVNLAVRDVRSSDPYVVFKIGKQKVKTRVMKRNVNPEWNEELTLSVQEPILPVKIKVYDHDTFTTDDKMGDAEFDIKPFVEAQSMNTDRSEPSGTKITSIQASRKNCLAEESCIYWENGKVTQDLCLRLRNVERGELELELHWIDLPKSPNSKR